MLSFIMMKKKMKLQMKNQAFKEPIEAKGNLSLQEYEIQNEKQ